MRGPRRLHHHILHAISLHPVQCLLIDAPLRKNRVGLPTPVQRFADTLPQHPIKVQYGCSDHELFPLRQQRRTLHSMHLFPPLLPNIRLPPRLQPQIFRATSTTPRAPHCNELTRCWNLHQTLHLSPRPKRNYPQKEVQFSYKNGCNRSPRIRRRHVPPMRPWRTMNMYSSIPR